MLAHLLLALAAVSAVTCVVAAVLVPEQRHEGSVGEGGGAQ
jgi:hypothetical protein